jgi:putative ABC transport system substrate-binding protein
VAGAQLASKSVTIGVLSTAEPAEPLLRIFGEALRDLGYVEGQNTVIERRYAEGRLERLPGLAAELARMPVGVIVATDNLSITAAKKETATVPIVMVHAVDPVRAEFIGSLARPGGNITGLTFEAGQEISGKLLATLKEIDPRLSRVAILRQVGAGADGTVLEAAGRRLGLALQVVEIKRPDEFDRAFATMTHWGAGAFMIVGGPLTYMRRHHIADLALRNRLPGIHFLSDYAEAGLLISYGPSLPDLYRRAAGHVAKILRGARPADLPVEQPTKFDLVINRRTARALGLTIPPAVLLRADQLIE